MDSVQTILDSLRIQSKDYPLRKGKKSMSKKRMNMEPKDIKIRGINEELILSFDRKAVELTNKLNRPVSRNEYIKMVLESQQAMPVYELQKKLLEETIDRFTRIMEMQNDTFERYIESNEMMIELMTGIPIEELRGVNSDD